MVQPLTDGVRRSALKKSFMAHFLRRGHKRNKPDLSVCNAMVNAIEPADDRVTVHAVVELLSAT